jgi:hypothetical protein
LASDDDADLTAGQGEATHCARHPQVETVLTCGRCGTPICPRCLVQTPVGARCPDCANVRRLPTIDVGPVFVVRGLAGGLAAGAAVGAVWGYAVQGQRVGFLGFFLILVALAAGWAIGEAVSLATNRKRGRSLQACAIAGAVLAYFVHNLVGGFGILPSGDFWGYAATVLAAFLAAERVRA